MSELTPYLCVANARTAIDWYREVLGAEVVDEPIEMPDGRIGHAELALDGARWMLADEFPEAGVAAPTSERGAAVTLHLAVDDVDELVARVGAAGVPVDHGPQGVDHAGPVVVFHDPFGHRWFLDAPAG